MVIVAYEYVIAHVCVLVCFVGSFENPMWIHICPFFAGVDSIADDGMVCAASYGSYGSPAGCQKLCQGCQACPHQSPRFGEGWKYIVVTVDIWFGKDHVACTNDMPA